MFTKQQTSQVRQKFWINFGKYMSPIPSSTGEKITWINYRTGVKFIQFKMDAGEMDASISIEIAAKDIATEELYFNHFKTFKNPLEASLGEKWNWVLSDGTTAEDTTTRIYTKLENVNIHNENDWPTIITFLKIRIIALDKFWNEYKDIFDMLN